MFFKLFLCSTLLFSTLCFSTDKTSTTLQSTYLTSLEANYDCLPLHEDNITGNFFIIAKLNEQSIRLLLDTGCNFTNITQQTAQKLKLTTKKIEQNIMGVGGQQQRIVANINCLEILPNIQFKNCTLDINHLKAPNFDGILGMDILQNRGTIIDLSQKVIYFAKKDFPRLQVKDFATIPYTNMEIKHGVRLLVATINNRPVKLLLDTGGQQSLIDIKFAQQANLELFPLQAQMDGTGAKTSTLQYTILSQFSIGMLPLQNLACLCTDLSHIEQTLGANGMIAGNLLPKLGAIILIDENKIFFTKSNADLANTGVIPGYFPQSLNLENLFSQNSLICSAKIHKMPTIKNTIPASSPLAFPQVILEISYQITEIFQDKTSRYKIGDVLTFPINFTPKTKQWQAELNIFLNHLSLPIITINPEENNGSKIFQTSQILLPGSPARSQQLHKKIVK